MILKERLLTNDDFFKVSDFDIMRKTLEVYINQLQ